LLLRNKCKKRSLSRQLVAQWL